MATVTNNDRVFLTGATGLVGSMVARQFAGEGFTVQCLCRNPEQARGFKELQWTGATGAIEILKGDVTDVASIEAAIEGCSVVVHVAGVPEGYSKDGKKWDVNVEGTRNVVEAAVKRVASIKKFVHTSTMDTLKQTIGEPYDDHSGTAEAPLPSTYQNSKLDSELLVARAITEHSLPAVFIHPSAVYGPGVDKGKTFNAFLADVVKGKAPVVIPGGYPTVLSTDVAAAHVKAALIGRPGTHYLLSDRYMDLQETASVVLRVAAEMFGDQQKKHKAPKQLPKFMGCALAHGGTFVARLTGGEPMLPVGVYKGMTNQGRPRVGEGTATYDELGIDITRFDDAGCKVLLQMLKDNGEI